jgi:hypothetical protein
MTVSRVLDEPEDPTEARFRRVALAVVAILIARGPTEIRIASVSRRSGVSRAWIYKQFGKDTTALLDFTIRELGAVFAGIDAELDSSSVNAWIDSVELETRRGFSDAQQAPWVPALYFRYRHTPLDPSATPYGSSRRVTCGVSSTACPTRCSPTGAVRTPSPRCSPRPGWAPTPGGARRRGRRPWTRPRATSARCCEGGRADRASHLAS